MTQQMRFFLEAQGMDAGPEMVQAMLGTLGQLGGAGAAGPALAQAMMANLLGGGGGMIPMPVGLMGGAGPHGPPPPGLLAALQNSFATMGVAAPPGMGSGAAASASAAAAPPPPGPHAGDAAIAATTAALAAEAATVAAGSAASATLLASPHSLFSGFRSGANQRTNIGGGGAFAKSAAVREALASDAYVIALLQECCPGVEADAPEVQAALVQLRGSLLATPPAVGA